MVDRLQLVEAAPLDMTVRRLAAGVALSVIAKNPEEPLGDRFLGAFFVGSAMWCHMRPGGPSTGSRDPDEAKKRSNDRARNLRAGLQVCDAAAAGARPTSIPHIAAGMVSRMLPRMAAVGMNNTHQLLAARMVHEIMGPFDREGRGEDALKRMQALLRTDNIHGPVKAEALKYVAAHGLMPQQWPTSTARPDVVPLLRPVSGTGQFRT